MMTRVGNQATFHQQHPHTNANGKGHKVGATLVWSGGSHQAGTALLLQQHGRKQLVNPLSVSHYGRPLPPPPPPLPSQQHGMIQPPPPPPPPLSHQNTYGICPGGNDPRTCCACCYCCCEIGVSVAPDAKLLGHHHRSKGKSGHDHHQEGKHRRRRSTSKEQNSQGRYLHQPLPRKYTFDVRKIVTNENEVKPKFVAVSSLEDSQAIRCAEFHPKGHIYAVGSNSKSLRICAYPDVSQVRENSSPREPQVIYKRNKHHRGSIYCLGWSPDGQLLATGSNDKTVKISRFDDTSRTDLNHSQEIEMSMHDGTVRDVCFIEDLTNKSSLLVSGGAGDCKIYVTDLLTATPFQALSGHSAPILSLYTWGGAMFCSGSQDKSIRLWDLRTRGCVNVITPITSTNLSTAKSAVGSVCVDSSGRLLVSGHEDSAICLYDIRGGRQVQTFKPHSAGADVRSVRLSPNAYYLLSGGYDQKLMLTDLQGDLSQNLASIVVGTHSDKVISGRWHPSDLSFVSTSADRTVVLWALPSNP